MVDACNKGSIETDGTFLTKVCGVDVVATFVEDATRVRVVDATATIARCGVAQPVSLSLPIATNPTIHEIIVLHARLNTSILNE
jgi:hypothetical protein